MRLPVLPTAVFLSLALNLFLIGVIAGTWREIRGSQAPTPAATEAPPLPDGALNPDSPDPEARDPAMAPAQPSGALRSAPPPPTPAVVTQDPRPADAAGRTPEIAALSPGGFRGNPPPPGVGLPRPPGGNPLIIVTRDLPESEGLALRNLLRVEGEAVRADLTQARRERAAAWRALARGEVNEAEAARRLDMAGRRELAARSRVEKAVAEWALRQSPAVRARIGEALARDAQPRGRYPVRPDLPAAGPPPGPPGAAGES